jgi:opacity protein-like surface antigen
LIDLDLGIGYGQMDGLRNIGAYELHGSVRELPSVSAYTTVRLHDRFGVYAGIRTGVITLQDAQLFVTKDDGTAMFTLTSTSFEFGAPLGIDVQPVAGIHFTLEAAYMRRIFNSVSFEPTTGFPQDYPRSLDLSGWSWSAGIQFPLP